MGHIFIPIFELLTAYPGDRNREIGRPMPHRYNVMDHFIITHIWAEKINGYTGYMMRLQKMVLTRKSWWAAKGSPDPPTVRDFKKRPQSENCLSCMKMSERIFKDTWTCLHIACPKFWVHYGPKNAKLQYDKVFLSHRFSWDKNLVARAPALIPPLPVITLANQEEYRLGYYARHGIVCPLCKRCVPRIFWEGWRCTVEHHARPVPRANETGCSYSLILPDYVAPASEFIALPDSVPQTPPKPRNKAAGKDALLPLGGLESFWNNPRFDEKSLQPKIDRTSLAPYVRLKYDMGVNGTITHLVSNLAINAESSGPDYLFQTFQLLDLGLRRERLGVSQGIY